MYICQCHSPTSSQLTVPPPPPLKSILYVCVFIPVLTLGSSEPFSFSSRFHIYVLAYGICFSLADLLHSVWLTLGPCTSLQVTQFCFFLWLSKYSIVYMCHIFCIHSSVNGHLGCFHALAVVNSAAMNIVVHDSFWIMVSQGICPVVGLLGRMAVLFLVF